MRRSAALSLLLFALASLGQAQQTVSLSQMKLFPDKYEAKTVLTNLSMTCVIEREYGYFTFEAVGDSVVVMLLKNAVKDKEAFAFVTSGDLAQQLPFEDYKAPKYPCRGRQITPVRLTSKVRHISIEGGSIWVGDVVRFEFLPNGPVVPK